MIFHTNDGKSTMKICLKKLHLLETFPVYECGLTDTNVLEEPTVIFVSIYGSNLKSTMKTISFILGTFEKLRKVTISFAVSVHPTTHMEQLDSHWTDFNEI
jgi:hypothetical protein